ncbi:SCP-like protein [Ancylostoma duodenale]|uniref:SCP-like protein n=1 Tax=Ancylostoma duodenale TaxID=51022 RepID=A0A0C2DA27_9BILA|nr:SCP-like protein [Ancylostoma duodenale]
MGLLVKRNGNRLPSAANMLKMQYNCALQEAAYTHARLCTNTNSGGRSNIGENIAQISRGVASNKLQAIGKMAWSSTYRLGCGIAGCTGFYNIVCQYFPAMADTFDQNIYQPGTPCSACPSGSTCTDAALCNMN